MKNITLRWPLSVDKFEEEGIRYIVLSCNEGISDQPLVLREEAVHLLDKMNGSLSEDEFYDEASKLRIPIEISRGFLALIDEYYMLEGPRLSVKKDEIKNNFLNSKIRPAYFAGRGYSADKIGLANFIDEKISKIKIEESKKILKILHVPHIDYTRGSDVYASGYAHLKNEKYDVIFLMGTSHQYSECFAHFTKKDFESPLGVIKNAIDSTERLLHFYSEEEGLKDEIRHRTEHSLELQLPFIQRTLHSDSKIVPILIGSLQHLYPNKDRFQYLPYKKLIDALIEEVKYLDNNNKSYIFIAGVDMAHVGTYFGDKEKLDTARLKLIENQDESYLKYIENLDSDGLFNHVASTFDDRRICGFSTMMAIVDVFKSLNLKFEGEVFSYSQPVLSNEDCCVTISSVGFYQTNL